MIDFPFGFGFSKNTGSPIDVPKSVWQLAQNQVESLKDFYEQTDIECNMSQFKKINLLIMTEGVGANQALNIVDLIKSNFANIAYKNQEIEVVLSDPIISVNDQFGSLDAFVEGRSKVNINDGTNITNAQTKFMLLEDKTNLELNNLLRLQNSSCTANIYNVVDNTQILMPNINIIEFFDPISLSNCKLNKLIEQLSSKMGVQLKYTKNYDQVLKEMRLAEGPPGANGNPDPYGVLNRVMNDWNVPILIVQSQNDAAFNTLGLLKMYEKSNVQELENQLYSPKNYTWMDQNEQTIKYIVFMTFQGNFGHAQLMGVGYWMAKENPNSLFELINKFRHNELIGPTNDSG